MYLSHYPTISLFLTQDRFLMAPRFVPCDGTNGFRVSNPPVLLIAGARASLDLFDKVRP
jgi:kynureninase